MIIRIDIEHWWLEPNQDHDKCGHCGTNVEYLFNDPEDGYICLSCLRQRLITLST